MPTTIRPETTINNRYWIPRQRYYELKHFCLQYDAWKHIRNLCDGIHGKSFELPPNLVPIWASDPVAQSVEIRDWYDTRIKMLEQAAAQTDAVIGSYILKGVTKGLSYDGLCRKEQVPCCRNEYYNYYRKFFWILDGLRG